MKPDINSSTYGGKRKDFPDKVKRYFDDPRHVREVEGSYYTWKETLVYAEHYYASLTQEDNPFWDSKEKTWMVCWDDTEEFKGRYIHSPQLRSERAAKAWIKKTAKKEFPNHLLTIKE